MYLVTNPKIQRKIQEELGMWCPPALWWREALGSKVICTIYIQLLCVY